MPDTTGGKQAGRLFPPGTSGNPKGRPKGSKHRISRLIADIFAEQSEPLARKTIEMALTGDVTALRLALERILPRDRPVVIDLPPVTEAGHLIDALGVVTHAVAEGEISPAEGNSVAALLETHRKVFEADQFERRLSELERLMEERKR